MLQKNTLKQCRLYNIDSVGVDVSRFHPVSAGEKARLRMEAGYGQHDFIVIYIAEFIDRKNHVFLLRNIPLLRKAIHGIRIIFSGKGELQEECKRTAESLSIRDCIDFLGYRNDIDMLCRMADIYVSPSKQEGLPVSVLEAMASGLPVVCSNIRGHTDVIEQGRNGFLFDLRKPAEMTDAIITLYSNPGLRQEIGRNNILDAKKFSAETAVSKMADIYRQFMPSA